MGYEIPYNSFSFCRFELATLVKLPMLLSLTFRQLWHDNNIQSDSTVSSHHRCGRHCKHLRGSKGTSPRRFWIFTIWSLELISRMVIFKSFDSYFQPTRKPMLTACITGFAWLITVLTGLRYCSKDRLQLWGKVKTVMAWFSNISIIKLW